MAPASKRLVSKIPVLEELFAEHHYDSEKGHFTQAGNDGGTKLSDNDNRKEAASSETLGSKDVEDKDSSEDDMCDVSSPLMRRMSCPAAEEYSPRRRTSYSSSPNGLSKDAYPMRRMGCPETSARGHPMRRMACQDTSLRGHPMRRMGDDSPVRKATPPTKFRGKDLRVDVPDDHISWLQRTPLTQNNTFASSPLPLLDLSPITMLGEGNLFLGQTSASLVRPRGLSFSPSSDGSADFFKELSGSHHGSTSAHVSARRDQSETNTNSQGGTTLCFGDLSTTQPQRRPSTEMRQSLVYDYIDNNRMKKELLVDAVIQEAYVPSPVFEVLEETWDFKTIVQSRPSPVLLSHDVTFNQQFKIALGGDNWPRLWTKKFSTDETWEPTGGVRHLVLIPDVISDITAAPLVAFKSHSHKRDKRGYLCADALESFARIKKDIQNVCFSFFSKAERNWWHNRFMRQDIVATDTQAGKQIRLMRQWRWRSPQDEDTSRSKQPPTVITSGDLAQRILGERRPAYVGTRRARPGTSQHDRIHHIGDIKDLASGQMVAVLAEDDKSFWISKVIDIKSMTIDGEPNEVEIQWFATESTDPYVGKYYPEKKRDSGRGRATLFRQTLIFPDIRILAFDFSLTTTSRLRKTTVSQIRTQLFRLEHEVAVECGVDNANSPKDDDAGPQEQDS
ncbi:hypothetical protein R1sor_007033 [Riccia sorocarpa]|uniref:BAH domain-containing protein n=1 Tax=Riccia sorocarpa TaxID=122646 RepID=A0ABD3HS63_9MARC